MPSATVKTAADSAAGVNWYYYEKAGGSVAADGHGNAGVPKTVCVNCHQGTGSDSDHSGRDFVYTEVK